LIREYLFEHKSLSLEKIGNFVLTSVTNPDPKGADQYSITFTYDKKAETTPALIDYIAQVTGKNKVLINSDLTTSLELTRQFINIGNSYEIDGAGVIRLNKFREYEFVPYEITSGKEDHKSSRKKQHIESFHHQEKKRSNRGALMFIAVLIIAGVLGVIGWGTYKLLVAKNANTPVDTLTTANKAPAVMDNSTTSKQDSASIKNTYPGVTADTSLSKNDTAVYKFIFEQTNSPERAYSRTKQLDAFGDRAQVDSVHTDSSTLYQLYIKRRVASSDTAAMRDSLQLYFDRKVRIVPY
jgi:hypothetical protein